MRYVATILGTRACPILVEGRREEGELRWYSASGHKIVVTRSFMWSGSFLLRKMMVMAYNFRSQDPKTPKQLRLPRC